MTKDLWYKPKLIEVALPLEDINEACQHEKAVPRRGHPATLHLWWARRPLAACRAVLFAQLVDDPSAHPDRFPTEEAQRAERDRLQDLVSRLIMWENIHNDGVLREARQEILKATGGDPPAILDPFAGGGSIPLEAQRLGLEAHASDLNPVAVLINKALLEFPPAWAGREPVFPGSASLAQSWPGARGLAEDVRQYGVWIRKEAEKRIGHLYPKGTVSGVEVPIIGWIWARTAACPNPACGGTMPLVKSFSLGKKKGKERYVVPIRNGTRIRFEIAGPNGIPPEGTVTRTGAVCLLCSTPVSLNYIREQGRAGRLGSQLMATIAEGTRQRYYMAPTAEHETAGVIGRPDNIPESSLPDNRRWFSPPLYGLEKYSDLFTNRQLTALATFSDLAREVRQHVRADAMTAGQDEATATTYSIAVGTYLAFAVSKLADWSSSVCGWINTAEKARDTFARQAIPMVWDFLELYPLSSSVGNFTTHVEWVADCLRGVPAQGVAKVSQSEAQSISVDNFIVATDPPYYDNVGYADLSDFFYVWLRRTLGDSFPDLMATLLTPKSAELVADPSRHGTKAAAEDFFENGFVEVFSRIRAGSHNEYPISVFYAFKQSEEDGDGDQASTGWETLLEAMMRAGWAVTATWPMRTERSARSVGIGTNALASSIVLACRPRSSDAGFTDRRGLIEALRAEFPAALRTLEQGKIAPVDLRQAAIGPGMAIFSRYARVNEPDGSPMRVRAALSLINQVLDEKLSQLVGDVSADTRFCVEWFKQYGFWEGPFGTADILARGVDTGVDGLVRAGVLRSVAGKVRLRSVRDIPDEYDPAADERTSEWEICLHLAKQLDEQGTDGAARLMAAARDVPGIDLDDVRELAYLLYSIAEKKNWAEVGLLFNNLGTSWTDLEDAARRMPSGGLAGGQGQLALEFGSDDDGGE